MVRFGLAGLFLVVVLTWTAVGQQTFDILDESPSTSDSAPMSAPTPDPLPEPVVESKPSFEVPTEAEVVEEFARIGRPVKHVARRFGYNFSSTSPWTSPGLNYNEYRIEIPEGWDFCKQIETLVSERGDRDNGILLGDGSGGGWWGYTVVLEGGARSALVRWGTRGTGVPGDHKRTWVEFNVEFVITPVGSDEFVRKAYGCTWPQQSLPRDACMCGSFADIELITKADCNGKEEDVEFCDVARSQAHTMCIPSGADCNSECTKWEGEGYVRRSSPMCGRPSIFTADPRCVPLRERSAVAKAGIDTTISTMGDEAASCAAAESMGIERKGGCLALWEASTNEAQTAWQDYLSHRTELGALRKEATAIEAELGEPCMESTVAYEVEGVTVR